MAKGTCYDSITSHIKSGGYDGLDLSQISVAIVSYSYGAFVMIGACTHPRSCCQSVCHRKSCFSIDRGCALSFYSSPSSVVASL